MRRKNRKKMKKEKPEDWIFRLKKQLEIDEGIRHEIYLDHLGYPTFGIGHLITERDPEYLVVKEFWPFVFKDIPAKEKLRLFKKSGKKIAVSDQRVSEAFSQDVTQSIEDIKQVFEDFDQFSDNLKEILVNMVFNLGLTRFRGFKKMIAAIEKRDFSDAANEMIDSRWYKQVGNRAKRLVVKMNQLVKIS